MLQEYKVLLLANDTYKLLTSYNYITDVNLKPNRNKHTINKSFCYPIQTFLTTSIHITLIIISN